MRLSCPSFVVLPVDAQSVSRSAHCNFRMLLGILLLLSIPFAVQAQAASQSTMEKGPSQANRARFLKPAMSFEPNVGQSSSGARYLSRGEGYLLELGPASADLRFPEASDNKADVSNSSRESAVPGISLSFVGANPAVEISGEQKLPGEHNYLPSGDPATWRSGVPTFGRVHYRDLYPGIDLAFYGNPDQLEYDFQLQPHADPAHMRIALSGADAYSTDASGNLVLQAEGKTVRFLKPVAYQVDAAGKRLPVEVAYLITHEPNASAAPQVSFALGDYDASLPLTVDPILNYSFFLPATVNNYLYIGASTTDANGNTYVAGTFPIDARYANFYQAGFFVAKFNVAGAEVINSPFGKASPAFQGIVTSIAVDASGNMYVTGEVASGALPVTTNAYATAAPSPYSNGFFAKISADGKTLLYCTYFGGNAQVNSVAVDSSGNAYVVGNVGTGFGTSLPVTPNAPLATFPGQFQSGFLAKFNPTATGAASLVYSTLIGSPQSVTSSANSVAVDSAGNAYVTGNADGSIYPTTSGAYQYNGRDPKNDAFVTKVNAAGTSFTYSALLGPGAGKALLVDKADDVYVAGTVYEDDFPTTSGAYQTTYPSGFLAELNPQGSALIYSTFLGGPEDLFASGASYVVPTNMALPEGCASACDVYLAGYTTGTDFPLINEIQSYIPGGTYSAFYLELAGNGSQALQSSYFASGGSFDPYQNVPGIGVDSSGDIYLTGDVLTSNLAISQTTAAYGEGFLAKIQPLNEEQQLFAVPQTITFPAQVVGASTSQQGLTQPTVLLENLSTQARPLTAITVTPAANFSQTNNCGSSVPAGGYCTLTLNFTPTTTAAVTGTIVVSASDSQVHLSGTGQDDRFVVASCGGVSPCPGLTFADTSVGASTAAQIITLTNLGDKASPLPTIASSLPDYLLLNNCPQTGTGLPAHGVCEISVQFRPTQAGLRSGTVSVVATGTVANAINISAMGTGELSPNASSLVILNPVLNFGTETQGLTTTVQTVVVANTGTAPVTIFAPVNTTSGDASGVSDYVLSANTCTGKLLEPQTSCTIGVQFAPTAAGTRAGTLQITSSASTTPLTATLTGIGVATKQNLEFSPDSLVFPNQVIDFSSAANNIYVYNAGPSPVTIDRVLITGAYQITASNCPEITLQPQISPTQYQTCSITVVFSPKTTGLLTGTITVVDTEGSQSAYSLAGTGVAQSPSLFLDPDGLFFGTLPVGGTSGSQAANVYNVGNVPLTVTAIATAGDYAISHPYCNPPFTLQPGTACGPLTVSFTPTKVSNPDAGTLTVTSTAGSRTVNLTGAGVAATKSVLVTPPGTSGVNFGTVAVGGTANSYPYSYFVNVYNTGTDPVTFLQAPTITGTNASDFAVPQNNCTTGQAIAPGASCNVYLQFSPTAAGTRTAILTLSDDGVTGSGHQTVVLTGSGSSTPLEFTLRPSTVTYAPQVITTTSAVQEINFVNQTSAPITIASVVFGNSSFVRSQNYYGDCNEGPVAAGSSCAVGVAFAPTVTGSVASTVTLKDSAGKSYAALVYATGVLPGRGIAVSPSGLNFSAQPQLSTSAAQTITLTNVSGTPAATGQATGTNVILGSTTTGAFKVTSDGCSNNSNFRSDYPNNACGISVVLSPTASTAVGTQSGSISIPVTYRDKTTATFTIELNGTVTADSDVVEVSPSALTFPDQAVNVTPTTGGNDSPQFVYLTNNSNLPLKVGQITGSNTAVYNLTTHVTTTGQFSVWAVTSGDSCSLRTVNAGASCSVQLAFTPTVAGLQRGSLSFPVTFTDGKTQTLTAAYSGTALAAKSSVQITPDSANFGSQEVGSAYGGIVFNVTNNGNQPLSFVNETLTSTQAGVNFTRNGYGYNQCGVGTLQVGSSCPVFVQFQPQTTGTINGILTIGDPAASGGPHKIPLVGVGLAANQVVTTSQTAINFGSEPVGLVSSPEAVYLNNHSTSNIGGVTYALSGTNAADFTLQTSTCGGTLYNLTTCELLVSFSPAATSLGARSATLTVTLPGTLTAIKIALSGTGVAKAPAAALFPNLVNFTTTNVGSRSAPLAFAITNTGSANLIVGKLSVTNTAEFAISSDGCSGKTIAAGADCLVYVTFSPTLGGTRTGSITVPDNASGSPQTEQLTGFGYGIPKAAFTPSSVAFGNQNLGTASTAHSIVLSNPGTDSLKIASIAVGGTDLHDFKETNSCPAILVPAASCTITVSFAPTAPGSRTATLVVTGNLNNVAGSTQSAALSGVGIAPLASATPTSLTFPAQGLKTTSAAQVVTLHNTGTEALTISSIHLTGSDAADFALPAAGTTCTASLAANATCTVTVTFTPSATGTRVAALVFTDNSLLTAGSTQSVAITGTGE
jgi:beta-propeller repeat-containing protein/centrosomal CEP192-like protein